MLRVHRVKFAGPALQPLCRRILCTILRTFSEIHGFVRGLYSYGDFNLEGSGYAQIYSDYRRNYASDALEVLNHMPSSVGLGLRTLLRKPKC